MSGTETGPAVNIVSTILVALEASSLAVLQVALVVTCGFSLSWFGMLDKGLQKNLNILNANLFTPALIISKIAPTLSLKRLVDLKLVPLAFVVFTGVSALVGYVTSLVFQTPPGSSRIVMACAMAVNSNSLPIALVQSLSSTVEVLKIDTHDTPDAMLGRGVSYLVLYSTLGLVWRWSVMVPFLAKADAAVSKDEVLHSGDEGGQWKSGSNTRKPPFWRRAVSGFLAVMTPPLWAAIGSIFIAVIPPLQNAFVKATPLASAIESVAGVSIPITLIVLGAYFSPPRHSPPPSPEAKAVMPGASRTVWAAVLGRMVFSPLPLYAILASLTLGTLVAIFDDPIFLLSMFLLAGGPTALTIAQLTCAASPQFEKIISRVIFLSYVVFLLPLTVVGTVMSIIISTAPDLDDALEAAKTASLSNPSQSAH